MTAETGMVQNSGAVIAAGEVGASDHDEKPGRLGLLGAGRASAWCRRTRPLPRSVPCGS
ncbi:hypothetical protein ACI2LF_32985 [Kribbella sp. NPDC020789]